jgi:hypothetical protein
MGHLPHWAPLISLPHHKWPIAPKPGPYDLYCVNELNIEKTFKKQNLLVSILEFILFLNV